MLKKLREILKWGLLLVVATTLVFGCATMKKWVGWDTGEEDEEAAPPEAKEETVQIDGKTYIRSKNPYWLSYPNQPEYIYVEKGREFVGAQQYLINALAKAVGREKEKAAGKSIPPDKLQELVKAEVDRILREQGLGGFVSQARGEKAPYTGRAVAVIPDLDTPTSYEGLNRTLAMALSDTMGRQKDIKTSTPEQIREALGKSGSAGKTNLVPNIRPLADALGVQAVILTGVVPGEKGGAAALALQVFDGFSGSKELAVATPVEGGITAATATKFAQDNALRVAGELYNIPWFGRVDFVKEGKVYLNLGQSAGLKVGDRLRVVTPGKPVVNPSTNAILGYTADVSQGELKVTELLGNTGAVAVPVSGGPFNANDKVKAVK